MDKRIISRRTINMAVSENEGHECPSHFGVRSGPSHVVIQLHLRCSLTWIRTTCTGCLPVCGFSNLSDINVISATKKENRTKFRALRLTQELCQRDARLLMRTLVSANSPILTSMRRFNWMRFATAARKHMHRSTSRAAAYPLLCRAANFKIMSYFHSHQ